VLSSKRRYKGRECHTRRRARPFLRYHNVRSQKGPKAGLKRPQCQHAGYEFSTVYCHTSHIQFYSTLKIHHPQILAYAHTYFTSHAVSILHGYKIIFLWLSVYTSIYRPTWSHIANVWKTISHATSDMLTFAVKRHSATPTAKRWWWCCFSCWRHHDRFK